MSFWRLISASLRFHRRINLAVALGVAAATAVLTGALIVGDSVKGSLRELTLDGLGRIDQALVTDRFFRAALAVELESSPEFQKHFASATPLVLFPRATLETGGDDDLQIAGGVTLIGCDDRYWRLGPPGSPVPRRMPEDGQIVLNQPLADELNVQVGDQVTVRLVKSNQVPADSPLGRKSDRTRSLPRLEVIEVLPAEGLGRFSLLPSQHLPRNAWLPLAALQEALDQGDQANAILVAGASSQTPEAGNSEADQALRAALQPTLEDYGFSLGHVVRTFQPSEDSPAETVFEYYNFTTDRMIFSDESAAAAEKAFAPFQPQPVFTYLANLIKKISGDEPPEEGEGIPYSTISALESTPELGPLLDENYEPIQVADNEIVLVDWAAEDLKAQVGDTIRIAYFAPETTHGQTTELTADFRLKAIAPLTEPAVPYSRLGPAEYDQRPQFTNDPDLTPVVEGITDQDTIDDWDAPFPMTYRVRSQDDDYWENHRTTPKAYISLAAGQRLWGSRFGRVTSFRIPASQIAAGGAAPEQVLEAAIHTQLAESGEDLGFAFTPVKRRGLEAAKGTTPFSALFLGFSFFIIAAALMLTALLFRLGLERRAREFGLLLAVGTPRGKTSWIFVIEGAIVAALGALIGVAGGVGYAWLMIYALRTLWVEAIVTPFVNLHAAWPTLLLGYASGVAISALTIAWTARRMRQVSVRRLMSGQAAEPSFAGTNRRPAAFWIAAGSLAAAVALAVLATQLRGELQAGAFFGGGAAVLVAALVFLWTRLRTSGQTAAERYSLSGLAARSAGRNPLRSTLTIGLMATACFLIVAISAFRMAPTAEGVGGFDLLAESDRPLFADLNDPQQRRDLLGPDAALLENGAVLALRLKPGEDASCRNIYQTTRPRVIGVPPQLYEHFSQAGVQHFAWSASDAQTEEEIANPWLVLRSLAPNDDSVPMILDKNTAMYSLHLTQGVGEIFEVEDDGGRRIRFRVAGLLSNTILQGSLFIDEEQFKRLYPEISGYSFFLIQSPGGDPQRLGRTLEGRLSDFGFDVQDARQVLTDLLAVQNTYLSTFQSLGALGLLLGVFGLATVQLRSVLERRGELALMRAVGFRRNRLAEMVMLENAVLIVGGLAVGVFAAMTAVAPHIYFGGANVPLSQLAWMLGAILLAGLLAGLFAVRAVLRAPLLTALRDE
jgi:ABC-type antimicrobial peptide transport system permease subunit